jgi:hypothetical protein
MKQIDTENGSVMYLNSGDWVENLTALEYHDKTWCIYEYKSADYIKDQSSEENDKMDIVAKILQE